MEPAIDLGVVVIAIKPKCDGKPNSQRFGRKMEAGKYLPGIFLPTVF